MNNRNNITNKEEFIATEEHYATSLSRSVKYLEFMLSQLAQNPASMPINKMELILCKSYLEHMLILSQQLLQHFEYAQINNIPLTAITGILNTLDEIKNSQVYHQYFSYYPIINAELQTLVENNAFNPTGKKIISIFYDTESMAPLHRLTQYPLLIKEPELSEEIALIIKNTNHSTEKCLAFMEQIKNHYPAALVSAALAFWPSEFFINNPVAERTLMEITENIRKSIESNKLSTEWLLNFRLMLVNTIKSRVFISDEDILIFLQEQKATLLEIDNKIENHRKIVREACEAIKIPGINFIPEDTSIYNDYTTNKPININSDPNTVAKFKAFLKQEIFNIYDNQAVDIIKVIEKSNTLTSILAILKQDKNKEQLQQLILSALAEHDKIQSTTDKAHRKAIHSAIVSGMKLYAIILGDGSDSQNDELINSILKNLDSTAEAMLQNTTSDLATDEKIQSEQNQKIFYKIKLLQMLKYNISFNINTPHLNQLLHKLNDKKDISTSLKRKIQQFFSHMFDYNNPTKQDVYVVKSDSAKNNKNTL